MITAKNYAAQAEEGLKQFIVKADSTGLLSPIDKYLISSFVAQIGQAVHFSLPDNAILLGDSAKGLRGECLRLPYPCITIEYYVDGSGYEDSNDMLTGHYPKRFVYAIEMDGDTLRKLDFKGLIRNIDDDKFILVYAACADPNGLWVPDPMGMAVRQKWDNVTGAKRIEPLSIRQSKNGVDFCGLPIPLMPIFVADKLQSEKAIQELTHDISMEVRAVIELCEALSCSNVEQTIFHQAAKNNEKRKRQGKLPIYETKFLTIKQSSANSMRQYQSMEVDRNSPRQHLRRGHIRRLPDKNVWVNSCVVGNQSLGVIDKQYLVNQ